MEITHFFSYEGEDYEPNGSEAIFTYDDCCSAIDSFQWSHAEDADTYLSFNTDNNDSFEVIKSSDVYSGTLRVIVEKKLLGFIPLRYDKMFEYTDVTKEKMHSYLKIFFNTDAEALLRKIKDNTL